MFDFNQDGRTDNGEQFIASEIFNDTTGSFGSRPKATGRKLETWEKIAIGLLIWQVLNMLCGGGH